MWDEIHTHHQLYGRWMMTATSRTQALEEYVGHIFVLLLSLSQLSCVGFYNQYLLTSGHNYLKHVNHRWQQLEYTLNEQPIRVMQAVNLVDHNDSLTPTSPIKNKGQLISQPFSPTNLEPSIVKLIIMAHWSIMSSITRI